MTCARSEDDDARLGLDTGWRNPQGQIVNSFAHPNAIRPYQREAVAAIEEAEARGIRRPLLAWNRRPARSRSCARAAPWCSRRSKGPPTRAREQSK